MWYEYKIQAFFVDLCGEILNTNQCNNYCIDQTEVIKIGFTMLGLK